MALRIYGSSDDNLVIEGDGPHRDATDEIGCYNRSAVVQITDGIGQGLRVVGHYAPDRPKDLPPAGAVWSLAVEPLDEDIPIPWPVRVTARGYSPIIQIECCVEGVTVETFPKPEDE